MPATLLAAIDAPVPVQQQTTAWSARPSTTSRAAASQHQAQSSRSPSASAPCGKGSWPRRRSSSTTASATPVRSSAATEILIAVSLLLGSMPELPEVEITARRLSRGAAGAAIESALAPGMVTMKTFDPPLEALAGETVAGVGRVGKMLAIEAGELVVLVHLMSAGRLQLWKDRASLRDRASRLLIRLEDGRELRLREFGTQQRAWAKLLPAGTLADDDAVVTLGPDAYP